MRKNWEDYYKKHTTTAEAAVKLIDSGNRVVFSHACGEPPELVAAMMDRADELENVEIVHMVCMGQGAYCRPEYAKSFRHNALFVGANSRKAVNDGRGDFTPNFLHESPRLFRDGPLNVDVAMITVSPPDKAGNVCLGISIDWTMQAALSAKKVIAAVNPNMPRIGGNSCMHVSQIECFVPTNVPLIELGPPVIGDVEKGIGKHIADLINDGDCLQLGIGALPDAVLGFLGEKNDLGIHSEMISDGAMNLVKEGVITCARKTLRPGKIVICFAMGTRAFYEWLNENSMIEGYPCDYTNDPFIIAQNDNMTAINSAILVDLLGQVAADTLGAKQYSGIGGQVDFVRGASRARGGKSIIAMESTAAKGTVSRIAVQLMPGQAVTTSRSDVDYVVTEYGSAKLRGLTVRARAEALINIAHPMFRDQLREECKSLYGF
ncbi:MAG: acetyl-CoA hydrolase/transferase C-terminal domain-containing protein [Syntrophobacteraceae bacterium]|jgi:4-hydroxybutyrate CoA-transferase